MKGNIYTDEKCPVCGSSFRHDPKRRGLFCPNHPLQKSKDRYQVWFGKLNRRFTSYKEAVVYLEGLRHSESASFSKPLPFIHLSDKWLNIKKADVRPSTYNNLSRYIKKAALVWEQRDIRSIAYSDIEDFLYSHKNLSRKTISNMKSCLYSFFTWCSYREGVPVPRFPSIKFELGYRKTIDKETQQIILLHIKENCQLKAWLGIKWLTTYISCRPMEIMNLREKDIDIDSGRFIIPYPKEKKLKFVPMISEDIEIMLTVPRDDPEEYFFRHGAGLPGCIRGRRYGKNYFYRCWKKACSDLGVEGVDLYGGTRHSSAMALRSVATPEEIRRAMMTSTNKAFERYFRIESDEVRNIYEHARG